MKSCNVDFLLVNEIVINGKGEPTFLYKWLGKSEVGSEQLDRIVPKGIQLYYYTLTHQELLAIVEKLHLKPPAEWLGVFGEIEIDPSIPIEGIPKSQSWQRYIGQHFLDLNGPPLSNYLFEDTVADLLIALGFEVVPKGHLTVGEYPDGVAVFRGDFSIVYDCKNRAQYFPPAEDKRALDTYYKNEKLANDKKYEMFSAFIAKSFDNPNQREVHLLSTESLSYLLYKKLLLGDHFTLSPMRKILANKQYLTHDLIDKEWQKGR
jgi:hypothetical protein